MGRHSSKYSWTKVTRNVWEMVMWSEQEQVIYRVSEANGSWQVRRWIAGAADKRGMLLASDRRSLFEARGLAELDVPVALM